jgi:hypothetical protein
MVKHFLKVGTTYFDLSTLCSFRFYPDYKGYIKMYMYFLSRETPIRVNIKNKNELCEFIYRLDTYMDEEMRGSLQALVEQIDKMKQDDIKSYKKKK